MHLIFICGKHWNSFCFGERSLGGRDVADGLEGESEYPVIFSGGAADEGSGAGDDFAGVAPVSDDGDAGEAELLSALEEGDLWSLKGDAGDAFGWDGDAGESEEIVLAVDADAAGACFDDDFGVFFFVDETHAAEKELGAKLGNEEKELLGHLTEGKVRGVFAENGEKGGVDENFAVSERIGGDALDGKAGGFGFKVELVGGFGGIGDANGGAAADGEDGED